MVEKVKALCDAIDTLNSLPRGGNTDARLAELSEMLLAECKQMVATPSPRQYYAGETLKSGEPIKFVGCWAVKLGYSPETDEELKQAILAVFGVKPSSNVPAPPKSNEGFHTLVPPTPSRQDIARATLLREMGEINDDIPSGQKIYPDLGLPRLP